MKETFIKLAATVPGAILFCLGSFMLYWTAWGLVFGSKYALMFAPMMTLFSGGMIFVGIIGIKRGYGIRKVTWIIPLGATSLYASCFFLYFGLKASLFPRFPADVINGSYGIWTGSFLAIVGIILVFLGLGLKFNPQTQTTF